MALDLSNFLQFLNGSTGSSEELREKVEGLERELVNWSERLTRAEARKTQSEFDLAPERELARIEVDRQVALGRVAGITRRIEETRRALTEAEKAERLKARRDAELSLHADCLLFDRELLSPCIARAAELLPRAEALGRSTDVTSLLALLAQWIPERRQDFYAGLARLAREPTAVVPPQRPAATPAPSFPQNAVHLRDARPLPKATSQRPVTLDDGAAVPSYAAPLPDAAGPVPHGRVRVRTLRPGYPDPQGRSSQSGRTLDLDAETAKAAAKAGAVEILQSEPALLPSAAPDQPEESRP